MKQAQGLVFDEGSWPGNDGACVRAGAQDEQRSRESGWQAFTGLGQVSLLLALSACNSGVSVPARVQESHCIPVTALGNKEQMQGGRHSSSSNARFPSRI